MLNSILALLTVAAVLAVRALLKLPLLLLRRVGRLLRGRRPATA